MSDISSYKTELREWKEKHRLFSEMHEKYEKDTRKEIKKLEKQNLSNLSEIERLNMPKNFSYRPILIHVNGVKEVVIESGYFAKIINMSDLLFRAIIIIHAPKHVIRRMVHISLRAIIQKPTMGIL